LNHYTRQSTIIFILLLSIIIGCGKDEGNEVTGKVILSDNPNNITPAVSLFNPAAIPSSIENYSLEFPQCGAIINQSCFFDHRLQNPIKTSTCSSNGDYTIAGVSGGYYIAVFTAEGFGWRYSPPFNVDGNHHLGTIELFPVQYPGIYITSDEIWASGHQYFIQDSVRVEAGATLTVEPGVWVLFGGTLSKISILGVLMAVGDEENWIRFTSDGPDFSPADWNRISLVNNSDSVSTIEYALMEYANTGISANSGKAALRNVISRHCYTGVAVLTQQLSDISRCTIYDCRNGFCGSADMRIDSSLVSGCDEIGIAVYNTNGWIYDTIVEACSLGFKEDHSPLIQFEYNLVHGNCIGLEMQAGSPVNLLVQYNNIVGNSVYGMRCFASAYPHTHYNNFIDNPYAVYSYAQMWGTIPLQDEDIDAEYNYWNTTSPDEISAIIRDGNTPGTLNWLGIVNFIPFLTQTEPAAGPR